VFIFVAIKSKFHCAILSVLFLALVMTEFEELLRANCEPIKFTAFKHRVLNTNPPNIEVTKSPKFKSVPILHIPAILGPTPTNAETEYTHIVQFNEPLLHGSQLIHGSLFLHAIALRGYWCRLNCHGVRKSTVGIVRTAIRFLGRAFGYSFLHIDCAKVEQLALLLALQFRILLSWGLCSF